MEALRQEAPVIMHEAEGLAPVGFSLDIQFIPGQPVAGETVASHRTDLVPHLPYPDGSDHSETSPDIPANPRRSYGYASEMSKMLGTIPEQSPGRQFMVDVALVGSTVMGSLMVPVAEAARQDTPDSEVAAGASESWMDLVVADASSLENEVDLDGEDEDPQAKVAEDEDADEVADTKASSEEFQKFGSGGSSKKDCMGCGRRSRERECGHCKQKDAPKPLARNRGEHSEGHNPSANSLRPRGAEAAHARPIESVTGNWLAKLALAK